MAKKLTKGKAKKILSDKDIRGKKLTPKQERFFGFVAGGGTPTRTRKAQTGRPSRSMRIR